MRDDVSKRRQLGRRTSCDRAAKVIGLATALGVLKTSRPRVSRPNSDRKRVRNLAMGALLVLATAAPLALADGPPPRDLASPAARRLNHGSASEYWDLTIELEQGYIVVARFLITNQGPGSQNGVAVGHVISPGGEIAKFRNGKLEKSWTLSEDGRRLDIKKCHLDMHAPRYTLQVDKSSSRLDLSFAPNTLYPLPRQLLGRKYRVDLLALGAEVRGSIKLAGMTEPARVNGWATLTHTISKGAETDLGLRRIELLSQRGDHPFYLADFLSPSGKRSRWLGYLESGCETARAPGQLTQRGPNHPTSVQKLFESSDLPCLRRLVARTAFDLTLGDAIQPPPSHDGKDPYWIPHVITLNGLGPGGTGSKGGGGRILLKERFLQHDPLKDLPGPIRFLAGLSTKPKRVWSVANFEVTIPPSSNSKPIQIQGQGVATVSFLNPVTRP